MPNSRRQSGRAAATTVPDRRTWAFGALLILATLLAYQPAFRAEFIRWDDPQYVSENELLRSGSGLGTIWTPFTGKLPQYYPLTFSSYWIEYQLWQLTPAGYHATNVLLHAVNALLVLQLLRMLGASLWVAFGAAAVFALHPVQVESVMWVTERKNTLSACFFLITFLLYLRHRRTGNWGAYGASLAAFVCALLSKTQTVSLPVILCLTEWLLQRNARLQRADAAAVAARIAPMLVLGLLSTWLTTAVERQMTLSWVQLPTLLQRVLIAANAPWYYLGSFLAPFALAPIAPKWVVAPADPVWWAGVVAWVIVSVVCVHWHARVDALPKWGAGEFLIALLPAIGLVPFAYQHYTYAAMRFVYLSCIGGGVVLAALAERLAGREANRRTAVAVAGVVVLVGYAALTHHEATHWQSNFSFWSHAVERNPESYPPNINLGLYYESRKQWADAARYYQRAYEVRPMDMFALTRYLRALNVARGPQAVVDASTAELQRSDVNASLAYFYRGAAYEQLGRREDAIGDYDRVLAQTRQGSDTWEAARRARDRLTQPNAR